MSYYPNEICFGVCSNCKEKKVLVYEDKENVLCRECLDDEIMGWIS